MSTTKDVCHNANGNHVLLAVGPAIGLTLSFFAVIMAPERLDRSEVEIAFRFCEERGGIDAIEFDYMKSFVQCIDGKYLLIKLHNDVDEFMLNDDRLIGLSGRPMHHTP